LIKARIRVGEMHRFQIGLGLGLGDILKFQIGFLALIKINT